MVVIKLIPRRIHHAFTSPNEIAVTLEGFTNFNESETDIVINKFLVDMNIPSYEFIKKENSTFVYKF